MAPSGHSDFEARLIKVLRQLGPGEVVSYGEVAAEAGSPGAARAVGGFLRHTSDDLPWWRVVRADGAITSPNAQEQAVRLRAEGVGVAGLRVVGWRKARARERGRGTR